VLLLVLLVVLVVLGGAPVVVGPHVDVDAPAAMHGTLDETPTWVASQVLHGSVQLQSWMG
jgi:hypothetical protein